MRPLPSFRQLLATTIGIRGQKINTPTAQFAICVPNQTICGWER